ncbi:MAG TPA: DUF4198 domain-containing protein [Chitinophagaceae bacterium]|nr:DUF4198 domain-containing protein [Chitinophagaceae bacterium]
MKRLLIFMLLVICTSLGAHEFWLEPQKFNLKRGEHVILTFKVGEHFEGENWRGNATSVKSLKLFYANIQDDLESLISPDAEGDSLSLQFYDDGTALVAYQSTNKHIELEAAKFNEYLEEDGLHSAIEYRQKNSETDSIGRENYMRCAKTLFQVGANKDDAYKKYCSMPLEFVPVQHPYLLRKDETLTFRLLFQAKPVPGALVKVWHKLNNKTEKIECTTNDEGLIEIPLSLAGKFMISSVRMERLENEPNAQWQSYWATFTWGY